MRILLIAGLCTAGCTPDLGAPPSLVAGTRLLAVRGEPAEAAPGATVTFTALVGSPSGSVPAPGIDWGFCSTPKPLAENNVAAEDCLGNSPSFGGPAGEVQAPLPLMGCSLFGPKTPQPAPGMPPLRPRDPDVTGGYYQPLLLDLPGAGAGGADLLAIGLERILCGLASAPDDVIKDYAAGYPPNRNPVLDGVWAALDGQALAPLVTEGAPPPPGTLSKVPAGARLTLEARFGEGAAETYPVYDPASRALIDRREALRVSWFASGGAFDHDRTGRSDQEPEPFTDNGWTAPASGPVTLWAVLRDSRGGAAFASFTLDVSP